MARSRHPNRRHRPLFADTGHALDFLNKAFEAVDLVGWHRADAVLPSIVPVLTASLGSEEMEIAPAFESFKGRAEALDLVGDPLMLTNLTRINTLALAARLPAIYPQRTFVEAGGLMSYGPDFANLYRRAGEIVDKILRGAKPADIPVEQPTKFDLVINLITSKALGIDVPPSLLATADEVIE